MSTLLLATVLVFSIVGPPPATALAAPYCPEGETPVFRFGFAQLKESLGAVMGEPTECEHQVTFMKGNVQPTTTGVAYFPESTRLASFSDGFKVWQLTPEGIVETDVDVSREAGKLRVLPIGLRDRARCTELGQQDRVQDQAAGLPLTKSAFPRTGTGLVLFINTTEGLGFEWIDNGMVTARVGVSYGAQECIEAYLGGFRGAPLSSVFPSAQPAAPAPKPVTPPVPKPVTPPAPKPSAGPNFSGASAIGAKFNGSNLSGANFTGANLRDADFSSATLRNANFTNANLTGAKLGGANLDGVTWSNTTCPDGSNSNDHGGTCIGHGI